MRSIRFKFAPLCVNTRAGHRQLGRLVSHTSAAARLEVASGVVQDLVIKQVHDVPKIPGADLGNMVDQNSFGT